MSIARIATLATVALLLGAAPSLARIPTTMETGVSQSVIDQGPQIPANDPDDAATRAQAELDYLQKVCPTVLSHPGTERANLVEFCHEYPGA